MLINIFLDVFNKQKASPYTSKKIKQNENGLFELF